MYWIFLIIFIISIFIPDILRTDVFFLSETRAEEISIFLLGASAFILFIIKEKQLLFHKKEKEKDQKKIDQTVKDLVESYSYIGEVNRKIDILMHTALGFSNQVGLDKKNEEETYASIINATTFLLKAKLVCLKFVNVNDGKTQKEFCSEEKIKFLKNEDLIKMDDNINIKRIDDCLIVASNQVVKNTRGYLVVCKYDEEKENSPKNIEILKVFVSQALFLHSYARSQENNKSVCKKKNINTN